MSSEEIYNDPDEQEGEGGSDELYEHYRFLVDKKQEPLRIDKYVTTRIQNASRTRVQAALHAGNIQVEGKAVKPNYKVRPQETITILLPTPPRDTELKPENIPLDIIYEDDHLLLVNKPAGMVVHPGFNNYDGTLVNALLYHFEQLPTANGERRPGLVHRIDKDTSGLLLIAKDEYSMSALAKQFFEHSIDREYLALAWGNFEEENGTVNQHLGRSPKDRRVSQVFEDGSQGKHAITHYEVKERFGYTTLVECRLETGRTHQIRAHMAWLRHPLFNDAMYGGADMVVGPRFSRYKQFIANCFELCPRQALHARSLGFTHPHTKERMYFEVPVPADIAAVIEKWRTYSAAYREEMEEE